ncbi:MAG: NAD(P)H-dependent amine dehydrogenase family protein [Nitrososphaeria archaeon]
MSVRVAVYGLGPIGMLIAKEALKKKDLDLVAAFDIDPSKVGRDLGEILESNSKLDVVVSDDVDASTILRNEGVEVVLHSTSTYMEKNYPQIVKCVEARADVISTSETLCNPWYRYPELAILIDELAKKRCVSVVGTGVNPGFVFDTLPSFMTAVCTNVDRIHVVRSLDASKRRYSFQRKYGLGLSVEDFRAQMVQGLLSAHVGYGESISMVADNLGVKLTKIVEGQDPLTASKDMRTKYFEIKAGAVSGIRGYGVGFVGDREFIRVELLAEVEREEYEEILIEGTPSIRWRSSGTAGDIATAAMVINVIPRILNSKPGLLRMNDLPLPSAFVSLRVLEKSEGR